MIVSKDLQDKAMRFIIDYYESHNNTHYINKDSLVIKNICKKEDVDHLINVLKAQNLIDYGPSKKEDAEHIQILPDGHIYFENLEKENRESEKVRKQEEKDTRRFWIEILKDILIFVFGLIVEGKFGIVSGFFRTLFLRG